MSKSSLKQFYRTQIKVAPGGPPVGTTGANRAAGVLAALDQLTEEAIEVPANQRQGGPFYVIYLTKAEAVAAGRPNDATLDQLDPALLCLGATVRVDLHPAGNGVVLTLCYDARPAGSAGQVLAYLDGSFHGARTIPARWLAAADPAAVIANVPLLDPAHAYLVNDLVRYPFGSLDYLFRSANGGAHPAPATYAGNADWVAVALPIPATVLAVTRELGYIRYLLANNQPPTPGVRYTLTNWPDGETIEVEAGQGGFAALGTLVAGSTRTAVRVDVAAGTYQAFSSQFAALLGQPGDNAALAAVISQLAGATNAQKQRIDAILAGADGSVDTFIEAYNRFVADESAAAALNGQVSQLQTVQGQQGQQIAANTAAIFGRFQGPYAGGVLYKKGDEVITPDGKRRVAAKADFTQPSLAAYDDTQWTTTDAVLTPLQAQQLDTYATQARPLYLRFLDGTTAGYDTLNDMLAALIGKPSAISAVSNVGVFTLTASNSTRAASWPAYFDAAGTSIYVGSNLVLSVAGAGLQNLLFANFFLFGAGTCNLLGNLAQNTAPGQASMLLNGYSEVTLNNDSNVVVLFNGYYKKLTGAGKYYLYGTVQVDDMSGAANVVDKRPGTTGGGSGPTYTAGPGIAISAQNVISALGTNYGPDLHSAEGYNGDQGDASTWVYVQDSNQTGVYSFIPMATILEDAGGRFHNGHFTADVAGKYQAIASVRLADNLAANQQFIWGVNTELNYNNSTMKWDRTSGVRNSADLVRNIHLGAGQQLDLIIALAGFSSRLQVSLAVRLIRPDTSLAT